MSSDAIVTSLATSGDALTVAWADGVSGSYAALWLRDNL